MIKLVRLVFAVIVATTLHFTATSQSLSINTTGATADPSAILDVTSTLKGMLVPRMDKTEKNAIATPANGLLVFQTGPDSIGFHYYDLPNTQWVFINTNGYATDTTAWKITGNANITSSNFLGTTNDSALRFRVRNIPSGILDSASLNTALGYKSLSNTTTGVGNTSLGYLSNQERTTGNYNTAIGVEALQYDTSGSLNTAVGWRALRNHVTGIENTAVGVGALESDSSGNRNTSVGRYSTFLLKKGNDNTALGYNASTAADSTNSVTAIGMNALSLNKKDFNTAVGRAAGANNNNTANGPTEGIENSYLGYHAGVGNWNGSKNTAVGHKAIANNFGGIYGSSRNTAVGDSAMAFTYGGSNTAVGVNAMGINQGGFQNVAMGDSSMGGALNTIGNVAIGYKTLSKQQGQGWNTAVGFYSQRDSSKNTYYNTSIGAYSMEYNRIGVYNTGLGLSALRNSDSASYNTAVGADAMYNHRRNGSNVAVGAFALRGDSAGYSNTAVGSEAMDISKVGSDNTAIGFRSLRENAAGFANTAVGVGSLEKDSSGNYNTGVGRSALFSNRKGNYNTAIGFQAGTVADTAYEVTQIGTQAGYYNRVPYTTAVGTNALFGNNFSTLGNPTEGTENTGVGWSAMLSNIYGRQNTAMGFRALASTGFSGTGSPLSRNTAMGDSALNANRGNDNTSVGYLALSKNIGGSDHVAVGSRALANATANYPNTAVGYSSQDSATFGFANTAMGSFSLMANKVGYNNTAIGNAAMMEAFNPAAINYMFDNTAVGNDALRLARYSGQTAVGSGALRNDTAGIYNTAVGYFAMYENKTGTVNTAIGTSALRLDTSGSGNTAVGVNALFNHKTGNNNIAMGYNALSNSRDGNHNIAIGTNAMLNHKTNDVNTAVGYESMGLDTSGSVNTALGWRSLYTVKNGFENVALGVGAIEFSDSSYQNTAVGRYAMFSIGGTENTAVGYRAMGAGAGGPTTNLYTRGVTSVGANSGFKNTGAENTFVGYNSGYGAGVDSLKGIENTGLGSSTLTFTTTGRSNTAVGMGSLYSNSTGSGNIGVGTRSLFYNSTASYNVAVGDSALIDNTSGSSNTGIGSFTNVSAGTLTNATAIGARAFVAQNNSIILGSINGVNGATSDTRVGIRTTTPDSTFSVADNFLVGSSGTVQYDNAVPVMNYMFKTGTANADRMIISHSTGVPTLGLQYQDVGDKFNFLSSGTGVLTADLGTQRVGVGTISPQKKLHVFAGTSGAVTNAASQILMEDDATSYLEMSTPAASDNGILSSIPTTGIRSGIIFGSNNSLQLRSGGNVNRLYIDNAGYTGINRTPTTGVSAGTFQIQNTSATDDILGLYSVTLGSRWTFWIASTTISGPPAANINDLTFWYNGTIRGAFNNANGNYTSTSDRRLKKDVVDYNYGIAALRQLNPYKYHYIDNPDGSPLSVGFMAQDVEKVYPEAVHKVVDKEGKPVYMLDYQAMSVLTIKAIQDQQQIIDKQQKTIDDLLKRVEKLEQK